LCHGIAKANHGYYKQRQINILVLAVFLFALYIAFWGAILVMMDREQIKEK